MAPNSPPLASSLPLSPSLVRRVAALLPLVTVSLALTVHAQGNPQTGPRLVPPVPLLSTSPPSGAREPRYNYLTRLPSDSVDNRAGTRGAVFGGLLLGAAGGVIGAALCNDIGEGESCVRTTVGFAALGATIGAVVGALIGGNIK